MFNTLEAFTQQNLFFRMCTNKFLGSGTKKDYSLYYTIIIQGLRNRELQGPSEHMACVFFDAG